MRMNKKIHLIGPPVRRIHPKGPPLRRIHPKGPPLRRILAWKLAALMAASAAVLSDPAPVRAERPAPEVLERVPGRWIVELAPGASATADHVRPLARDYGGSAAHLYRAALQGFTFRGTDEQAERLAADPRVRRVEPVYVRRFSMTGITLISTWTHRPPFVSIVRK
jgi:hypothetical protein